jgi:O-antigen ligase
VGWLFAVVRATFALTILLVLMSTTWRFSWRSVFAQLTFVRIRIGSSVYSLGVLLFLPLLVLLGWLLARLLERPRRPWCWGALPITLSVLALGVYILVRMGVDLSLYGAYVVLAVGFLWSVYFFTLQDWPAGWALGTLAFFTALQGIVGTLQFIGQHSLGLRLLGERLLSPTITGACVIESAGHRWLRAYGLTPHPDVLGGYLGMGVLLCLGAAMATRGWRRLVFCLALALGGLGLFFSFSRSAWLGVLAGLAYYLAMARPWRLLKQQSARARRGLLLGALVLAAVVVVLVTVYGDLLVSRFFRLESALEKGSLVDRVVGIQQGWTLVQEAPLFGVGPGHYLDYFTVPGSTTRTPGFRMVHVAPLLAMAELGVLGAALWVWFVVAPPLTLDWQSRRTPVEAGRAGLAAAVVALAVISWFQFYPYLLQCWWPTGYLAVLAGVLARGEEERGVGRTGCPIPGE